MEKPADIWNTSFADRLLFRRFPNQLMPREQSLIRSRIVSPESAFLIRYVAQQAGQIIRIGASTAAFDCRYRAYGKGGSRRLQQFICTDCCC